MSHSVESGLNSRRMCGSKYLHNTVHEDRVTLTRVPILYSISHGPIFISSVNHCICELYCGLSLILTVSWQSYVQHNFYFFSSLSFPLRTSFKALETFSEDPQSLESTKTLAASPDGVSLMRHGGFASSHNEFYNSNSLICGYYDCWQPK